MGVNKMGISPLKAIRKKCLDCCGEQYMEVKGCPVTQCNLWKFRLGIHPFTKKNVKNPFLEPNNYKGRETCTTKEIIKYIEGDTK